MRTPVWFRIPPQFAPVDLAASPEERAASLSARLVDRPERERDALVAVQEETVRRMLAADVRYAALVLVETTGGLFTVALRPGGNGLPRGVPVEPPAGPAVLVTERTDVDGGFPALQRHAILTHPGTGEYVVLSMATEDGPQLPVFARLLGKILETVTFTGPAGTA